MQPTSPGRSPAEPSPALRSVLDLPLRFPVPADAAANLDALALRIKTEGANADWLAAYARAIEIVETLAQGAEAKLEELQRKALELEDPNEVRQRLSQGPRRDAEKARSEAKAAIQKAVKEWTDRSRRQLEHVTAKCTEAAQQSKLVESKETAAGLELKVDATWWAQWSGFVARCAEEWTKNVTTGVEASLVSAASAASAALASKTAGKTITPPGAAIAIANEVKLPSETPSKEVDVPSTGAALMGYVRQNVMAVGIFGTVVAVLFAFMGKMAGGDEHGSSPNTMLVRGGLILAVLPFSIFFGLRAAKRQRKQLGEKALGAQKQAVQTFLKTELDKALEKHRKALERFVASRADEWTSAVDKFWEQVLEGALADADREVAESVRALKIQQAKLSEEQAGVRTFRTQLSQNLLFELKKRQRELRDG